LARTSFPPLGTYCPIIGRLATPKLIGLISPKGYSAMPEPTWDQGSAAALTIRSRTILTVVAAAVGGEEVMEMTWRTYTFIFRQPV
jgi:hypothetical protein